MEDVLYGSGSIYYVSENGNDNNSGLKNEPIKTVSRLNRLELKSGDRVLFERGSVFRTAEPVNAVSGVSYGAYGNAANPKPVISGSLINYASSSLWNRSDTENVWQLSLSGESAAGVMTFNGGESCGSRCYSMDELRKIGDYYHDISGSVLYLYFNSYNPGEYFADIEIGTTEILFEGLVGGKSVKDCKLRNIGFEYATRLGADFQYTSGITVSGCVFSWIGGANWNVSTRLGNAVQFWAAAKNCSVEYCAFNQIYDAAVTFQGKTGSDQTFDNISFNNNLIEYCSFNFEFWGSDESGSTARTTVSNIGFTDNIVRFCGYGWGGRQRSGKYGAMLLGQNFEYTDNVSEFKITGNIFDCASKSANCNFIYAKDSILKLIELSGNSYFCRSEDSGMIFSHYNSGSQVTDKAAFEAIIKKYDKNPAAIGWIE